MLGSIFSSSRSVLSPPEVLDLANDFLEFARKNTNPKIALILCDDVEASLSQMKKALRKADAAETLADQTLRDKIAVVYFEHGKVLDQLGQHNRAQASYKKAQKWGHPGLAPQSSILSASAALPPAALTNRSLITAQTSETLHVPALSSAANPSSAISADIPSTLSEPVQNAALSPRILEGIEEKNDLVNELFIETLKTFQNLDLSSVWPSAFLVYAHDNPHYGMADAGTAKFLIEHLVKLGVNLYSDQRPKGLQAPAALSTRADAARVDDILTSQLCLLPTAIGAIKPVDKVIVCGSQVLGHYLQWGEAGKHYQAYCADLKKAYGLAQQNPAQAETEIRTVVNTYSQQADFHHVLTEMAFLKIRTDYLDQHGIIPVSLSANGYELCVQDFVKATTVRIEDMPRFASQQASGQAVYQQQGRHLVFFKLLERLLAQNGAEALLRTFWTAYADLIKRLNSEASAPKAAEYVRVWGQISQSVQATLQALQEQVNEHELHTALTRYVSLDRLAIQRLSGPPLSMKHCYINLAIVEHKKIRKEEEKPKEGEENKLKEEAAQNHFHRLPSFETIDSNQQKLVPLETLFDPRELSDGKTVAPKRILIRGRAGVGKTTLSKKIVYDYTQKAQWRDRFDWLFWIPLRTLKGKSNCDLTTLFHETYFQGYPNGQALAKALEAHINGPAKDKTLFVLDGWDEIAQEWGEHEPMSSFMKQLLNQPAVLITSRPYVDLKQAQPMDLELETVGFSPENVTAYLDNRDMMAASDAKEIKHFIQTNTFIQGLVNVPIQLDALCYSWDEIKRMQKEAPSAMTVTALYQAMMNKLWRKDMLRLGKREGGELLTASQINALERPSRIEKLVQAEHDFLSTLAFRGLQRNQIEFHHRDLHTLIEQLEAQGVNLPLTLEANLKKLSFLHTDDAEESRRSYHFMHLTFQEFFTAKHFVAHWEAGQEITLLSTNTKGWTRATPEAFVRQHKYNPRYEILWWFVAGLLRGEALNRFFILLEAEPRDLLGAHHQRLLMNCLHETSRTPGVGLLPEIRDRLEQGLAQWLQLEIDKRKECTLAYQPTFPEHLLLQCLQKTTSTQTKRAVATAFGHRSALSESALLALIALAKDRSRDMRCSAADVLGQNSSLPESALLALIVLAKDEDKRVRYHAANALGQQSLLPESALLALIALAKDEDVRYRAAYALGKQSSLPESALLALIVLLKDKSWLARGSAATALGQQSSLPESVLLALTALANDENLSVRHSVAEALGQQSSLPESVLLALTALLKHKNGDVRRSAVGVLGKQSSLSESALQALTALVKDEGRDVRCSAADVLGKQSSLSESAMLLLVALVKDENGDARSVAATALGQQSPLPESALLALIALAEDESWIVRRSAAKALEKQSSLPESALQALIALTKDENEYVRDSAAEALGQQSSLPESALQALIALAKDENRDVRRRAADVLGQQSSLPESALQALVALLKDENEYEDVRRSAAEALGQQSSLPESALLALIALAKDEDESGDVRRSAAEALGQQSSLPESALLALIALLKDEGRDVRRSAANALGQQSSLPESALPALVALLKDENEYEDVRRSAANALGKQSSLPESALLALIALLKDGDRDVRRRASDALGQQSSLPESALLALIALLKDGDRDVRRRAAEALGQQSSLPESALLALIALAKDEDESGDVRRSAADALDKQSSLPESVLLVLIALLKDENEYVRRNAAERLGKHRSTFYRLLPTLNRQKIELIYKEYLFEQRFDQSAPLYIQDGILYFYTAEGVQTVPFSNPDQETKFRQAVQHAQQAVGIPFAPYLSTRGQVEQPDAQNGEEALVVPSISQTQWGPSKTDRGIQTEVFPTVASVNRLSSPHLSAKKKVLGLIKGFA
ncbi:HEAT repeat domain-containing protein [Mycoavidus sp. SF9855]|uniref:HEAT repeat domain-containing protein n=1 Tax=Mycoavidus sp. SF9855 TaxID=2968475 RepID=UPI00211C86E5|nr:HEAT repeat domain-containing protein [Mycoavidus sp. SF9855]UUM21120.1 HEAT repeat domain-containing protein [Mycoavidus sp. SF9855]